MTTATIRRRSAFVSHVTRWLSLQAYGLVTRALFRANTSPVVMRARFERFASRSREEMQRRFTQLRFENHRLGRLALESEESVP